MLMNNNAASSSLDALAGVLSKPYPPTRSRLGVVTKLFDAKFLLNIKGIIDLHEQVGEKLRQLAPRDASFGYLISFDDKTHSESESLDRLENYSRNSSKVTDRVVLKWVIHHEADSFDNELTLIVRISNPINPFVILQAALSKSPEDIDNLDFQRGSVSASVDGASQILSEELFSLVARWIESRPQPGSVTVFHAQITKHLKKIQFANSWIFPLMVAAGVFYALWNIVAPSLQISMLFCGLMAHYYATRVAGYVNDRLERWRDLVGVFSLFEITGGDDNQQTKYCARAKNSVIKLAAASALSIGLNVGSTIIAAWLFGAQPGVS